MALSESTLQMMLARDQAFLNRLQYQMLQVATEVKAEAVETPYHAQRTQYATTVINNSMMAGSQAAGLVVGGPNVKGTVTLEDSGVVTTCTDAALFAQVSTLWNVLAGVDSGTPAEAPTTPVTTLGAPPYVNNLS
jgi:hypothetical protein